MERRSTKAARGPGRTDRQPEAHYQVRALERGLAILVAFDGIAPRLTLTELADKVQLPKSTAFRLLKVLIDFGFVEKEAGGDSFSLGVRAFEVGNVYSSNLRVPQLAQPVLERAAATTAETAVLGVLQFDQVLLLGVAHSRQEISVWSSVGARFDACCSATGKVLLAGLSSAVRERVVRRLVRQRRRHSPPGAEPALLDELETVAALGFAIEDEERELGAYGVAAPVHDHSGKVVATIGLSAPKYRVSTDAELRLQHAAKAAAAELSRRLGAAPDRGLPLAERHVVEAEHDGPDDDLALEMTRRLDVAT